MEWKVYFEDNPGCHRPHRGCPGQEVSCGAHSVWGGQHFIIPAIYLCGKGLVVDICRRVEREAIEAHYQKLAAYEGMDIDECRRKLSNWPKPRTRLVLLTICQV